MKKTKVSKIIISAALFLIAAVLLISSVAGYIIRGLDSTSASLKELRTGAVLKTASTGLIESIAADARLAKNQELRKDKNFRKMGTDVFQQLCTEAEEEARTEATALYSDTSAVNTAALEETLPTLLEKLNDYNSAKAVETAAYGEIYTAVMEAVPSWKDMTADKDEDTLWADLQSAVPALSGKEDMRKGMLKLATDQAAAEDAAALAEVQDQLWSSVSGVITDWSVYADADDATLWAAMTEAVPSLNEEETAAAFKDGLLASAKDAIAGNAAASDSEETEEIATGITVDTKYYSPSAELNEKESLANEAYEGMFAVLSEGIPALNDLSGKNSDNIRSLILDVLSASGKDFPTQYNTYAATGVSGQTFAMKLASNAENYLLLGIGVLMIAVLYTFWNPITKKLGVARAIILLFFLCLILAAQFYKINVSMMLGNVVERVSMYGVLVLAMLPGIQCGIGLNMGMTIGCVSGLFAIVTALNYNMTGAGAFLFSLVLGILIAIPLGWGYSILLNRMKGSEMTISTYVGFSFVSLMCMVWMAVPYKNPKIIWMLAGHGLRVTHSLLGNFAHILDSLLSFKIFGMSIPTGGLLFFGLCCLLMYLFTRSKLGISMSAVGSNPRFAEASGIDVNRMRTVGTVLSTVVAAVGIVVYSQAFGYAQLYNAPKQLGFITASAILIGGASVKKAKVSHVIIGVILFEGVLSMGQQVANEAITGGGLSEVMRILISNGIILYALTQSGGDQNA